MIIIIVIIIIIIITIYIYIDSTKNILGEKWALS